jgi:hypothetical protein
LVLYCAQAVAGTIYIGGAINSADTDGDGFADLVDNAPASSNPTQLDDDGDGLGDAADPYPHDVDMDADMDAINHVSDPNDNHGSVWTIMPTLTGPQIVVPGQPLSIPLAVQAGNGYGSAGPLDIPDYVILALRVDSAPPTPPAAHWVGGHTETSMDFSAADLVVLGLDVGTHQLTATADLLSYLGESSTIQTEAIPEPSTSLLALLGLLGLALYGWRRTR